MEETTQEVRKPRKKHGCLIAVIVALVLYVVMMGVVGASVGNVFNTNGTTTKLKDNSIYRLDLDGVLVEQAPMENPFEAFMSGMPGYNGVNYVGLDNILSNIRLAAGNDNIKGIYLKYGNMTVSPASAKAIRDALIEFKESGKWIVAYSPDGYNQMNYYIATAADHLYISPIAVVNWQGLTAQKMYYKRLLDNIGVEMQIVKVGDFKAAVEPFFRTSMSDEDRKQTELYLNGVWDIMKQGVAEGRHMDIEKVNQLADEMMMAFRPEAFVECGMVDSLIYANDMEKYIENLMGTEDYHMVSTSKMSHVKRATSSAKNQVAILYAEGEITDNAGKGIVATDMLKTIKKIAKNKDVKAVVFRVNSPGGSATASEDINHALQTLQQNGIPVIVSMGDMAASGGYYISCEADYIFAEPNTLTGSIGIFGTIPCWAKLRDKIGLDIDGVSTNRHSAMAVNMIHHGLDAEERAIMQKMVEDGYDLFTLRCAQGRHMDQDSIKAIGGGRIWLGQDALKIGLVDELGNIDDAIKKAAQMADLTEYSLTYYPEQKDPFEDLFSMFDNSTDEEKLIMRVREFVSEPRIMARMPEITIE